MTLLELCKKDVIQISSGTNLGRVDDLRFEREQAQIQGLVLMGRRRFFGLWGQQEDMFIPWQDIDLIGVDTILVHTPLPSQPKPKKSSFLESFFS